MNVLDRPIERERLADEQLAVLAWRELCFLQLGAEPALAIELALATIDLRAWEQLVRAGASPEQAARILC